MHYKKDQWINASTLASKKLYVDALNFNEAFGFTVKKWDVQWTKNIVHSFTNAARKCGVEVTVFIDAGIGGEEELQVWRKRREEDIKLERKVVPQGNSVILGDIFRELGVEVFYSGPEQNLDDCLASYAHIDGAAILSNDGDFFRYISRRWEQFGEFKVSGTGTLQLKRRFENKYKQLSPRKILSPKPKLIKEDPGTVTLVSHRIYRRGVPSALVKLCGNPHGKVIPLRQALYTKIGIPESEKVIEEWPEWKENRVEWHTAEVTPAPEGVFLFEIPPAQVYEKFFSEETRPDLKDVEDWEWENHLFACRAIVFEMWLIGQTDRKNMTLLSLLTEYDESVKEKEENVNHVTSRIGRMSLTPEISPNVCEEFKKYGSCKFGQKCFRASGHKICPYYRQGTCRRGEYCLFYHT